MAYLRRRKQLRSKCYPILIFSGKYCVVWFCPICKTETTIIEMEGRTNYFEDLLNLERYFYGIYKHSGYTQEDEDLLIDNGCKGYIEGIDDDKNVGKEKMD